LRWRLTGELGMLGARGEEVRMAENPRATLVLTEFCLLSAKAEWEWCKWGGGGPRISGWNGFVALKSDREFRRGYIAETPLSGKKARAAAQVTHRTRAGFTTSRKSRTFGLVMEL